MVYVWSSGRTVTITAPSPPTVSSVTITPERTEAVAPADLEFKVTAYLSRRVYDWEKVDVEIVLAVNSKDNIVARKTVTISPGYSAKSAYLTYRFSKPGTYTVWGGAKIASVTTYVYSPAGVVALAKPAPETLWDPVALGTLMFTGLAAGIAVYKGIRRKA